MCVWRGGGWYKSIQVCASVQNEEVSANALVQTYVCVRVRACVFESE